MSHPSSEAKSHQSNQAESPSSFFIKWGEFVINFRWICLGLTLFLAIGSAIISAKYTTVDMGIEAFTDQKSQTHKVLKEFRKEFGRDDVWAIAIEGDVFSRNYLQKLSSLHQELAKIDLDLKSLKQSNESQILKHNQDNPYQINDQFFIDDDGWGDEEGGGLFEDVLSLINTKEIKAADDGIKISDLFEIIPTDLELLKVKKRVLQDPTIVEQMVSAQGDLSIILLRSQFMDDADSIIVTAEIRKVTNKVNSDDFKVHIAGMPTLNSDLTEASTSNMQRLFSAALVLMIFILFYLFRHPLAVIAPIIVVMISALNTFGFMALMGIPMTILSMILPAFIVCVGLGDSVHLISIFRDTLPLKDTHNKALIHAVGSTAKPIIYTSLTTMIGLLSFRFASLEGIQQMGTSGAIGVLGACMHSLIFLPACLSFVKTSNLNARTDNIASAKSKTKDRLDLFLAWCNRCSGVDHDTGEGEASVLAKKRKTRTLLFGLGLVIALLIATSFLKLYHNPMSWFKSNHPLSVSFDVMDHKMGGSADIHLLIDGSDERGIKDVDLLKSLEKLDHHMQTFQHPKYGKIVGPVLSPLNIVKGTHKALHGGKKEAYRLPDTHRAVADQFFLFENAGPDQLKRLATNDLKRGRVSYRLKWIEANGYQPVADHLEKGIAQFIPKYAKVQATGTAYSLLSTIGRLIIDLITSFGFAFVVITILLIMQLQSIKLGLIAMIPNLTPILFIMGFMAIVGIPVDMVNLLIASVAIGIAVDDTIHFLHHFRVHFDQYGNVEQAIANSFTHAGRAMVSTTAILGIGFFAFSFATIASVQRFGVLIALTAVVAMLVDLIFTPALLRAFYGRKSSDQAPPTSN